MKRITWNSPAVLGFAAASLATLLLDKATGGAANRVLFSVYRSSWTSPLTYVRLFTHVLGHASWSHYLNNMMFLLLTGPMLEEKYGSRKLVEIMAAVAVSTGLVHIFLFSGTALLGASGIVFAFLLLSSITGSRRNGEIPLTLILVAVLYGGQQIYEGLFVADNVSQLTHLIGGLVGTMYGLSMRPKRSY
jgi:rhomboid protease GluP